MTWQGQRRYLEAVSEPKIPINVEVSESEGKRINAEERAWTAPKLVGLGVVSLGIALAILVYISSCQLTPLP